MVHLSIWKRDWCRVYLQKMRLGIGRCRNCRRRRMRLRGKRRGMEVLALLRRGAVRGLIVFGHWRVRAIILMPLLFDTLWSRAMTMRRPLFGVLHRSPGSFV